jgi:hypothetical protein
MRVAIVACTSLAALGMAALAPEVRADGFQDAPPRVYRPSGGGYRYRPYSYPPTVIRDGHSYFYFPGEARTDRPAEPCEICEGRDNYRYHYRRLHLHRVLDRAYWGP